MIIILLDSSFRLSLGVLFQFCNLLLLMLDTEVYCEIFYLVEIQLWEDFLVGLQLRGRLPEGVFSFTAVCLS